MHKLEVGQLYSAKRTSWPEVVTYSFRGGLHELVVFMGSPTDEEIRDTRKGDAEFALVTRGALIVLLYRFGSQPWSDAPYSWHLLPEAERQLPELELTPETRALLQVVLVDAVTGKIRALRQVTWSPEFTRAIHAAIRSQAAQAWDAAQYDRELAELYDRFDSGSLLLAATHRTRGGA